MRLRETTSFCEPYEESLLTLHVAADGTVTEVDRRVVESDRDGCLAIGRRPAGLTSRAARSHGAVGDFFARVAHLERASVDAFEVIARELAYFGAPDDLCVKATQAAEDEIRHTQMTERLAHRFGGQLCEVRVEPRALRSIFEFALDNAVEGCVRETFGALLAGHQAVHAQDPEIRAQMAVICADETRHAGLSWQLAAWLSGRLDAREQQALHAAQLEAIAALRAEFADAPNEALKKVAGLPTPAQAAVLVDQLERLLWSRSAAEVVAAA